MSIVAKLGRKNKVFAKPRAAPPPDERADFTPILRVWRE
jgi:hypothetical protein